MTWGKNRDDGAQRKRGSSLTAAYRGPAGMPTSAATSNARSGGGSIGGAPIWAMREAWRPMNSRYEKEASWRTALGGGHGRGFPDGQKASDPDGFAVFGRYPKGFLAHVIKGQYLGEVRRDDILHVCSGTLGPEEKWTVDIRIEARPRLQANGIHLPFRGASFAAVMLDPPYSDEYAKSLYKTGSPRPSWLLKEAARVVRPGGRVGILHVAVPFAPPGCKLINVWGISTGVGFRIRALTVYERRHQELPLVDPPDLR